MAHILVLEDDKNLCTLLGESLEDEGYRVTLCSDPESAIKQARTTSYDLMITDVRMAGVVDGVGALQAIKRIRPRIRSIVMTGYADSAVPARAANIQADEYLSLIHISEPTRPY